MVRVMKDSGVEWIGEIPEEWDVKKIKYILKERNEKNTPIKTREILSLSAANGVVPYSEKTGGGNKAKDDVSLYKIAHPKDIVMNSMNIIAGSVGLSQYHGCVSPVYYMFYSDDKGSDINYFSNIFQSKEFQRSLIGLGNGILIKHSEKSDKLNTIRLRIPSEKMKNTLLPVPPSIEQQKIAAVLDDKTTHIDNIIAKTKESIEAFKTYKQALITETVTKGLNPDVKMKDSGIEWVGEIPEHWEMNKMKRLGSVRNGLTYSPNDLVDEEDGTLVLRSGNIQNGKLSFNDTAYVSRTISDSLYVKKGDILICSRNGSRSLIGKNAIIDTDMKASFGAFMMIFRTAEPSKYIYYILNSEVFNFYLGTFLTATINQLTKNNFDNMDVVFCTDPEEQQQIVDFLDEKTSHIDSLIANKEKMVQELEAYKKAMIYEYVTGKKEVE